MNNQFRQLQKAANLSNLALAEWFEVDRKTITRWRNNDPKPSKSIIMSLQYRIKYGDL